ncbi:hypothetical protein FORC13_p252 (plasmid) [Bacillus cereus]|nr:hypothetical protein FORC13_p252 [Bacillus cereus]OTX33464.1 hypothetical protein BK717_18300 [Bacillus thuringiensis serovar malayensis]OUB04532.1 hypothetical protein BK709_19535 [Bacillus thuringiensis serovar shandongiensis]
MNLSIQDELQSFAEELQRYVTPLFLGELAKELGFVKRTRRFSGSDLATICIRIWICIITYKYKFIYGALLQITFHEIKKRALLRLFF